jgi:hypothetical protein
MFLINSRVSIKRISEEDTPVKFYIPISFTSCPVINNIKLKETDGLDEYSH